MTNYKNFDWRITTEERMLIAQWNRIMETCTIILYILHGNSTIENRLEMPKNVAYRIMDAFHGKKWKQAFLKYEREERANELYGGVDK